MCDNTSRFDWIHFNSCNPKRNESMKAEKKQSPALMTDSHSYGRESEQSRGSELMRVSRNAPLPKEDLFKSAHLNPENITLKDSSFAEDTSCLQVGKSNKSKNLRSGAYKNMQLKFQLRQDVMLKKDVNFFEVFAKGTKFMKSIDFPTVIVKFLNGNFDKSMIYYVILEPDAGESKWNIPSLLFSSPYAHKKTSFAELLPLYFSKVSNSVILSPMLLKQRFRQLFRRGCTFKVKSIILGRTFDCSGGNLWKMYDLRKKEIRNMLKGFIEQDIKEMSLRMTKLLIPMKLSKLRQGIPRESTCRKRKLRSSEFFDLDDREVFLEIADVKPLVFCRSEKVSGIVAGKGADNFAKLFKSCFL